MKFIIFLSLIVLTHFTVAQKKHWINDLGLEVKKEEATSYYTLSKTPAKTFILKRYAKANDILFEEISYPSKEFTNKNGSYALYFSNGKLAEEGSYLNDLKSGVWKSYLENGYLNQTFTFRLGLKEGEQIDYRQNQRIDAVYSYKEGKLNRLVRLYNDAGEVIFKEDTSEIAVYTFVDQEALFPGGKQALKTYLEESFSPSEEEKSKVYVAFNIDSKGIVTEVEVNELTEENIIETDVKRALKVVAKMPKWEPAMKRGRVVKSKRQIVIEF